MADVELVDIVDKNDIPIGVAPRKGIHKLKGHHRAVHIFMFDGKGRLWLELRAKHVDTYPLHYSSSAAGHVRHKESYLSAARREALEELGIKNLKLKRVHKFTASSVNEFITLFTTRSGKRPTAHEDTEKFRLFDINEIEKISKKEKFSPVFMLLFRWYMDNIQNL